MQLNYLPRCFLSTHCVWESNKNFDAAAETRSRALGHYKTACLDLQTLQSGYNLCHTQGVTQQWLYKKVTQSVGQRPESKFSLLLTKMDLEKSFLTLRGSSTSTPSVHCRLDHKLSLSTMDSSLQAPSQSHSIKVSALMAGRANLSSLPWGIFISTSVELHLSTSCIVFRLF